MITIDRLITIYLISFTFDHPVESGEINILPAENRDQVAKNGCEMPEFATILEDVLG